MRGRIRKLAPSTRNPVGWRNGGQSRAPKEQPLALDGTSVPKVRVASAVESVDVSELRPPWRNARIHSNKQIRQIANSIRQFGWTSPIVTDENKQFIAGFGRFKAAEQLGLRKVPVIVVTGLSEVEKRALALADNQVAATAAWDSAVLAAELGELAVLLPEYDLSIDITGFEPAEIDALKSTLVDLEEDSADRSPELIKKPVSRTGDLWLLGGHRLVCSDATDPAQGGKLMNRKRALLGIDSAVRSWQRFTKYDAILAGTTRTFDEVAAARSKTRGRRR
jgi:ParB/Sulfiredoxin domain